MDVENVENPVRDQGSRMRSNIGEDEIAAHHSDKWQNQAMYVGLHFPAKSKRHRRHRHRHHHKPRQEEDHDTEPSKPREEDGAKKPGEAATPPAQRVQFILGNANDDDVEHQSHDIFCEMDELRAVGDEGDMEWKETARWIKFEEDVEEGGERWSKPHVATLSLHSLFELRKSILTGTVMLDLEANNLIEVTAMVLDNMIASKQLEESERERVTEVLLSRHHHQHDKKENKGLPIIRSLADIGKRPSSKGLEEKKDSSGTHLAPGKGSSSMVKSGSSKDFQDPNASGTDLKETPSQHKFNEHFLKKIPQGAEASNILVGEVDFLSHPIIAFVRLAHSMLLGDLTEVPVPTRFIFIMLGPQGNQQQYHEIGRSIATLMSDEVFHDVAYKAKNRGDLLAGIDEFLDQVTVLPPGEWDPTIRIEPPKSVPSQAARKTGGAGGGAGGVPNGHTVTEEEEEDSHCDPTLERTGRLFGGLINDVKRKAPFYLSDVKDGLHLQTLASFFFMYFACLTPIITFGGLLGHATGQNMAAMESLMSGAICGISYHLFAGQPLTIIGSTGPVLVFETIVHHFCHEHHMNYLAFRCWIGVWVSLALLLIVMFDLSALVRYITRFTEESFALLIALIFIYEAFKKLLHILDEFPIASYTDIRTFNESCWCAEPNATVNPWDTSRNITQPDYYYNLTEKACTSFNGTMIGPGCGAHRPYPDVFFFSCLLFLFTYCFSYFGKNFKETRFLPNKVRSTISDFAVMLAIVLMVLIDYFVGLPTPKLIVPSRFAPTRSDRGWVVDPFKNPWWTIPAAIAPALLCTILIFMDQQITAVIVNRKEHKLKKGSGYHLDLFLIAIQMAICSFMGLPWFVAATVLSINHVRSLTRESESAAPGERPQFLGVREQRVTGIIVFLFVGLSVFLTSVLKFIPMPVLYGVFLFMGVSSMKGIELCQRIVCIFMPPKYQPDYVFLRHVPLRRVYLFTAIQVLCLAILWTIKTIKSISIVFPLMVLAMCFVRKSLDWVFTRNELKWLDDIMPEAHKREKEKKKEEAEGLTLTPQEKVVMIGSGPTSPTISGAVYSTNPESENDVEKPLLETTEEEEVIEMTGGAVSIPLKDGKSINIPVDRITYNPKTNQVNISEEMSKTAIWKQLAANESEPDIKNQLLGLRQRKTNKEGEEDGSKPVKFQIAEEDETDQLMPEIVVDPPSKSGTPEQDGLLGNKNNPDSKV